MSRSIFITATGTDAGKTYVSALIVKKLRESGLNAGYYKAALSGAEYIDGKLIAGDAMQVCRISKLQAEANSLVSYIYKTPVSPHLASQREGNPVEIDKIKSDFAKHSVIFDFITVEGSGGIVCPLRLDDKKIMLADVIKELNLDIIIVALSSLGTINSTVLTAEFAKQNGINVKGIILNYYEKNNFLHIDNKKQIEFLTKIPVIACISDNALDIDIDLEVLVNLYKGI